MAGEHVSDVGERTFQIDVIEASHKFPVLVDFWAEWCGPCKTLGPALEQLAEEFGGAFHLAKVDVDAEQQLSAMFRVQSIPTVFAVFQGQPVDSFQGALPAAELRKWVEGLFERLGLALPETGGVPSDPAAAYTHWQGRLAKNAGDSEARYNLARLDIAQGRIEEARTALTAIEATDPEYSAAQAALSTLALATVVGEAGGEEAVRAQLAATPDDGRLRYLVACVEASNGRFVAALTELVDLVRSGPAEVQGDVRKAASVVFEAAGRDDPEVEALRRQLALLLF